ncbi:hypothetical protein BDZ31_000836 [Conexibacter arvalis]|uniref:Uncharacterized protein n=1 Tax=Conexibacter arvalis TaxID=912552 RepID=A0A840IAI6_9ACTN|nr:hypothetical protein [Conexibacter arvalis]MBB4661263.1 hypothetical protein [Conexibacter arvalis]
MRGEEGVVDAAVAHEQPEQRGEAPGVGARADLEVVVGQSGGLRRDRVDHDQRALRIGGDLLQDDAGARERLRLPRVLAEEERDLGMLEVAARVAAVEVGVDEALAHLLLRQRARAVSRPERRHHRAGVGAAEVVALPAAAVVEDRLAAVLVADGRQPRRDLGDRRLPVDLLEAAVGPAPQRARQPVAAVLVVVEPQRLVAGVTLRGGVGAVAADAREAAAVELHLDPAVALAEDARALPPGPLLLRFGHRSTLRSRASRAK